VNHPDNELRATAWRDGTQLAEKPSVTHLPSVVPPVRPEEPHELLPSGPPSAPLSCANTTLPEDRGLFAGRYRIDSVLGTGGMGIVYAATHVELGLPVAIKIIHPSLSDSAEARARFAIEARAGAALSSPHTIRIHDAGQLGASQSFVVMERLEGTNLGALLEAKGPLSVETAVDYVLQACVALSEAHSIGIIHRDIKPENLFLAQRRNAAPLIKVLDFGIARWVGDELLSGRITNPRSSLGSPCYQSPEQMENAPDIDERSDIWSVGLVLFELLAGYCPFEADTIQETCWKVLQGPRPSLCAARPGIDPRLAEVVDRCLALDRSKRFASVRQLIVALKPFAPRAIETVEAAAPMALRPLPLTRMRRRASRLRLVALAAALTFGAGMAALFHPDASGLGHMVQSTSSSALVRASSAWRGLSARATWPSPAGN
jgi:eukaryotic-like serine/threonine-protein kinase